MNDSNDFVVIGLGRFGRSVALNLARHDQSVLAIDSNPELVSTIGAELESVACADATEEAALRELRVDRMGCAIVAIGTESMEASILTTALLKQLGVPRVVARSLGALHGRVLLAIGANRLVNPEEEIGERVARQLAQPNVLERMEIGPRAAFVEVALPGSFADSTLAELQIRQRFGVSVVAVRRGGEIYPMIDADMTLQADDVLLLLGSPAALDKIASLD
jgi:trk system potassium uptake protein TrkA